MTGYRVIIFKTGHYLDFPEKLSDLAMKCIDTLLMNQRLSSPVQTGFQKRFIIHCT